MTGLDLFYQILTFLNSVFLQSLSGVDEVSGVRAQQQQNQGQPFS